PPQPAVRAACRAAAPFRPGRGVVPLARRPGSFKDAGDGHGVTCGSISRGPLFEGRTALWFGPDSHQDRRYGRQERRRSMRTHIHERPLDDRTDEEQRLVAKEGAPPQVYRLTRLSVEMVTPWQLPQIS